MRVSRAASGLGAGLRVGLRPSVVRICMDNPEDPAFSCAGMQQQESKLVTPASLALDAVLVVLFFIYMYSVVSTHVPSKDHRMILLWGGLGSACLTGGCWLTVQMFRVVVRAQRAAARDPS